MGVNSYAEARTSITAQELSYQALIANNQTHQTMITWHQKTQQANEKYVPAPKKKRTKESEREFSFSITDCLKGRNKIQ